MEVCLPQYHIEFRRRPAMGREHEDLQAIRGRYARMLAAASRSDDPRIEQAFALVPREAFLPPGPWHISRQNHYSITPDDDPADLYENCLVALDPEKGINNGEPALHAAWIGAVAPKSGDAICHIGAGSGYYTAILAILAQPGGHVVAFEIDDRLAALAGDNLAAYHDVSVVRGDATALPLPPCDLIYVNAGVAAPPVSWLLALRPRGRMIFPWRPGQRVGLTLLVSRVGEAFKVTPSTPAWFIPCVGASATDDCTKVPSPQAAQSVRSVWMTADRAPDRTAVAIYREIWFSSASPH
jgi:protein-L-isoaspartate(D-aspartate) O-methyltransferase